MGNPWEAEPRTAVREPKLPGGESMRDESYDEKGGMHQGGPNRRSADRAPKPPWLVVVCYLVVESYVAAVLVFKSGYYSFGDSEDIL